MKHYSACSYCSRSYSGYRSLACHYNTVSGVLACDNTRVAGALRSYNVAIDGTAKRQHSVSVCCADERTNYGRRQKYSSHLGVCSFGENPPTATLGQMQPGITR